MSEVAVFVLEVACFSVGAMVLAVAIAYPIARAIEMFAERNDDDDQC